MVPILLPILDVLGSNLSRKVAYPDRFFFSALPQIFHEHSGTIPQRTSAHFYTFHCSHSLIIAPFAESLLPGLLYTILTYLLTYSMEHCPS